MKVLNDIIVDKNYTFSYRDKYNTQCQCAECTLFRSHFSITYPQVASFLTNLGVDIYYPIEIMDMGINDKILKREYITYYAVKGCLPTPKMSRTVDNVMITMRNHEIAKEAYANTGMETPFFIVELSNLYLEDI